MPPFKTRRKAPKGEQLTGELHGELGTYQRFGFYQRSLCKHSIYRYTGVLLLYQRILDGQEPTLQLSNQFLAHLRQQEVDPNTLKVYRAALKGFHQWRGEELKFAIKVPHRQPKYIEPGIVDRVLQLAKDDPRAYLMLSLMAQAGLRRGEVVSLKVGDVGETAIRLKGKGGRERTIPLSETLSAILKPYCAGKDKAAPAVGASRKAVYWAVKKYGKLAGAPELKPHDLRHAFAERMVERGANLRAVQELLGHSSLATTEVYIGVTGNHLKEAIHLLDDHPQPKQPTDKEPLRYVTKVVFPEDEERLRKMEFDLFGI